MAKEVNGYELSRNWFNWCFENPELINPNHTAIYFFAIEHCNRLGWKDKFGFPSQMVMDALGIKKHRTYIKYFEELCEWGFIKLIQKSQNQYSSNIISLALAMPKKDKAHAEALDKAMLNHRDKHMHKQLQPIGSVDKQLNNLTTKPLNNLTSELENSLIQTQEEIEFKEFIKTIPQVMALQNPLTFEEFEKLKKEFTGGAVKEILLQMQNRKDLIKKYTSANLTARNWLKNNLSKTGSNGGTKKTIGSEQGIIKPGVAKQEF